jgi:Tfp pilus assembly protein PilX
MQLTRLRDDERGSVLMTAVFVIVVMLGLGLALLSLNDVQAQQSGLERTRDHAFNLAESVLTSEAYALSHTWPSTATAAPSGAGAAGVAAPCATSGFAATIGATPPAGSATARIQPNLSASYGDTAYTGATWQANVCDDVGLTTVWSNSLLASSNVNWDANGNNRMWVRAQSTVKGVTRAVVGLVDVGTTSPLPTSFALINGSMAVDVPTAQASSGDGVLGGITSLLFGSSHPLAEGRVGVRCGTFSGPQLEACLGGDLAGVSGGLVDSLLGSAFSTNQYTQYPADTAVSPETIVQLRSQAIATGTYVASTAGKTSPTDAALQNCTKPAGVGPTTIWFIEQVGTGDQYCNIPAANFSPAPKMIVIGKGRVVIRGNGSLSNVPTLNTVVYALNLQRTEPDAISNAREVVRIDKAAKVNGAVFVDGKSGQVGMYPEVDCGLLGLGCLLGALLGSLANSLGVGPGQQGPLITYDSTVVRKVTVFTTSGTVPGTFRAL